MGIYPFLSCVFLLGATTLAQECPNGQIFYELGCIPCTQPCQGEAVFCTADCRSGCGCPRNYLTDNNGRCVPPTQCPINCPKNRIFYEANGLCAPCIQSCDSYLTGESIACPKICRTNVCECPQEYVTDAEGNCITKDQCKSSKCKQSGERYYIPNDGCAPCERTCKNVYQLDYGCTKECASNICRCHLGYVRTETKECIPVDKCPNTCPSGEVFYHGNACLPCERTCDNWYHSSFPCPEVCKMNVCGCRPGYVRNKDDVCVATSQCPPPVCGEGEIFYGEHECRNCEEWSANSSSGSICTRQCENNVCGCLRGYKRDSSNTCTTQCPSLS